MPRNTLAYDTDFFAWTRQQAEALRRAGAERVNADIDWDRLAEEIESMGKSDRRALMTELARVIEHLLKLDYSPAVDPREGWEESVALHRLAMEQILADSPSFEGYLSEHLAEAYQYGRRLAAKGLRKHDGIDPRTLPPECPYTLVQIRDDDWLPVNRHGLT